MRVTLALALGMSLVGCGGGAFSSNGNATGGSTSTGGSTGTGGGAVTGGSGGSGAATGGEPGSAGSISAGGSVSTDAGAILTACPPDPPGGDVRCVDGLACTYGDADPRAECRQRYDCQGGIFVVSLVKCVEIPFCAQLPEPPYNGKACSIVNSNCWSIDSGQNYAVMCACVPCLTSACTTAYAWVCGGVPATGCPALVPNLGQPCDANTPKECTYGFCPAYTVDAVCSGGVWTWPGIACAG